MSPPSIDCFRGLESGRGLDDGLPVSFDNTRRLWLGARSPPFGGGVGVCEGVRRCIFGELPGDPNGWRAAFDTSLVGCRRS